MRHYAIFLYAREKEKFNSDFVELKSRRREDLIYPDLALAPYCYQVKIFDSSQLIEENGVNYSQRLNLQTINIGEIVHYHKMGMYLYTQSGRLDDSLKEEYNNLKRQLGDDQYILKAKYADMLFLANKTDWLQNAKRLDDYSAKSL